MFSLYSLLGDNQLERRGVNDILEKVEPGFIVGVEAEEYFGENCRNDNSKLLAGVFNRFKCFDSLVRHNLQPGNGFLFPEAEFVGLVFQVEQLLFLLVRYVIVHLKFNFINLQLSIIKHHFWGTYCSFFWIWSSVHFSSYIHLKKTPRSLIKRLRPMGESSSCSWQAKLATSIISSGCPRAQKPYPNLNLTALSNSAKKNDKPKDMLCPSVENFRWKMEATSWQVLVPAVKMREGPKVSALKFWRRAAIYWLTVALSFFIKPFRYNAYYSSYLSILFQESSAKTPLTLRLTPT